MTTMMITKTRDEAIRALRRKLLEMTDDDHSMCRVASEKGIYCRGFRALTDEQMKAKYEWLLRRNPSMSREELEDLANRWQLARQIVDRVPISCDAQQIEHDTCGGWDTVSNADLIRFHRDLLSEEIQIAG